MNLNSPWSPELSASRSFERASSQTSKKLLVAASVAVGFALTMAIVAALALARFALLG